MNKMNTWAFSISTNLSNALTPFSMSEKKYKCLSSAISTSQHGAGMGRGAGGSMLPPPWVPRSRGGERLLPLSCGGAALRASRVWEAAPWFLCPSAPQQAPRPRLGLTKAAALLCKGLPELCLPRTIRLRAWLTLALLPGHSRRSPGTSPASRDISWGEQVTGAAAGG